MVKPIHDAFASIHQFINYNNYNDYKQKERTNGLIRNVLFFIFKNKIFLLLYVT